MKRYFLFLLVWQLLGLCLLNAQDNKGDKSPYLFDDFQDATVFMKGYGESKEKMNYDLLLNTFLFKDRKSGDVMAISNWEDIAVIRIGGRSFYQDKDGGIEIIPIDKVTLYVQYKVNSKVEAPKGAYGGSTETSSVTSYAGTYMDNRRVEFDPKKVIAGTRYNTYWIEKDNKKKAFRTFKQFLKVYSKHKVALEDYIRENKLDFDNVDQIKQLCLYAEGL